MWTGSSLLCVVTWITITFADNPQKILTQREINHNAAWNNFRAGLIKEYFDETTIKPSPSIDIEYCKGMNRTRQSLDRLDIVPIEEVIDYYSSLLRVNNYKNQNANNPMTTYGMLVVSNEELLPVYINADIRHRHLPDSGNRINLGPEVVHQMRLMGQLDSDDPGHLLPHYIGGDSSALNIVPMARNLTRNVAPMPDHRDLGIPPTYWRSHGDWIHKFLQRYRHGRVAWRIVVQYQDDVITNPNSPRNYRPIRFSVQYTAYIDQYDNSSIYYESPHISYLNNNNLPCGDEVQTKRPLDNVQEFMYETCNVLYSNKPEGKIGYTTSSGRWQYRYSSAFSFVIDGRLYFYSQVVDGGYWFIQELLPDGQMGEETDNGSWNYNYPIVIQYSVNGRHFFYGYNPNERNWFIQELLPGGKMGQETSQGDWKYKYEVCFPYTIDGKYYFYCQSRVDYKAWFIQELLPNGLMGEETDHGFWDEYHSVSFPFRINGRQFFYAHSHESRAWFIRELRADGKMGRKMSSGQWNSHQLCFPFAMNHKQYFYCQNVNDGKWWFIQELLPTGETGKVTEIGERNGNYQSLFPFMINGKSYFYAHSTDSHHWFIQSFK